MFIHPQGTRKSDDEIGALKVGVSVLARATQLPIVPIVSKGGGALWRRGEFAPQAGHVVIRVLPPIPASVWTQMDDRELTSHLERTMLTGIKSFPSV